MQLRLGYPIAVPFSCVEPSKVTNLTKLKSAFSVSSYYINFIPFCLTGENWNFALRTQMLIQFNGCVGYQ
jgi:hypothetical protein